MGLEPQHVRVAFHGPAGPRQPLVRDRVAPARTSASRRRNSVGVSVRRCPTLARWRAGSSSRRRMRTGPLVGRAGAGSARRMSAAMRASSSPLPKGLAR